MIVFGSFAPHFAESKFNFAGQIYNLWGEWPSGLYSFRQVTEVKLGRVTSNSGWVTSEA